MRSITGSKTPCNSTDANFDLHPKDHETTSASDFAAAGRRPRPGAGRILRPAAQPLRGVADPFERHRLPGQQHHRRRRMGRTVRQPPCPQPRHQRRSDRVDARPVGPDPCGASQAAVPDDRHERPGCRDLARRGGGQHRADHRTLPDRIALDTAFRTEYPAGERARLLEIQGALCPCGCNCRNQPPAAGPL